MTPWNLLSYSEAFDNAAWTQDAAGTGTISVTANYGVAPNGTTTADRIQMTKGSIYTQIYQTMTVISGAQYTISVYLKSLSGTPTITTLYNTAVSGTKTLTTEWVRYDFTFTAASSTIYPMIALYGSDSASMDVLAWGYQLNIGSTAKPYFPTTDRLNVPRLTYQQGGGGCPSLLLEKQSTNKCPSSNNFGTSAVQTTVTRNVTTSPAGVSDADRLLDTSANDEHLFGQNFDSITNGLTYTISVFFKADGSGGRGVIRYYGGEWVYAVYNLATGVVSFSEGSITTKIENYGNGWYRCMLTHTAIMDYTPMVTQIGIANSSNQFSYQGASNLGVYFWGFQAEQSSYVTSLIETNGSSATRVADACFKTGISSLFGTNQGTFFVDIANAIELDLPQVTADDNSNTNRFLLYRELTNGYWSIFLVAGGATSSFSSTVSSTGGKFAIAYNSSGFLVYKDGTQILSFSNTVPSSLSAIRLNGRATNDLYTNKNIKEAILFPTKLTATELAQLTA